MKNATEISDQKTALLFGATGLVGSFLLDELLADERYPAVKIFLRRPSGKTHPKLEEFIVDFSKPESFREKVRGDELFCCLGTTIRAAGSQEAFRKVDFQFVKDAAEAAKANGIKSFLVVSSLGADAGSLNFYYRTKGEMENAARAMNFRKCVIFRPSMLLGPRNEFRLGEFAGKIIMIAFSFLMPAKYKAIKAAVVAKAMIIAANDSAVNGILESNEIRTLVNKQ